MKQPRVPAGQTGGGQWTDSGRAAGFPPDSVLRGAGSELNNPLSVTRAMEDRVPIDDATKRALYAYIAYDDYRPMNRAMREHPRKYADMFRDSDPEDLSGPIGAFDYGPSNQDMARIQDVLMEPLDAPVLVYRQTDLSEKNIAKLIPGATIRVAGFSSTSLSPTTATEFPGKYLLEIRANQGRYLDQSAEQEFLLPHGAKFRVVGRRTVKVRSNSGRMYGHKEAPIVEREIIQLEQEEI